MNFSTPAASFPVHQVLLTNSIYPLAFAMLGILLLTIQPPPEQIWRYCSAFAMAFETPFAIMNFNTARDFTPDEFKGISKIAFYPLFAIGITTILLQCWRLAASRHPGSPSAY